MCTSHINGIVFRDWSTHYFPVVCCILLGFLYLFSIQLYFDSFFSLSLFLLLSFSFSRVKFLWKNDKSFKVPNAINQDCFRSLFCCSCYTWWCWSCLNLKFHIPPEALLPTASLSSIYLYLTILCPPILVNPVTKTVKHVLCMNVHCTPFVYACQYPTSHINCVVAWY